MSKPETNSTVFPVCFISTMDFILGESFPYQRNNNVHYFGVGILSCSYFLNSYWLLIDIARRSIFASVITTTKLTNTLCLNIFSTWVHIVHMYGNFKMDPCRRPFYDKDYKVIIYYLDRECCINCWLIYSLWVYVSVQLIFDPVWQYVEYLL